VTSHTSKSVSNTLVTVIGGSGFIGRHLVRALAKRGYRVRVACRRPDLAGHTVVAGTPGQVVPVQANVRFPASLDAACEGASAVINLTGILAGSATQTFDAIHAFGAEASAAAAKRAGATTFIQMSAIGADANSLSAYAQSKADGEARAKAAFPGAIIIRPSIVFGPEDNFFNQFASMARFSPVLPLIGGGESKFQPVFVGDVAEAIATLVDRGVASGQTYELGGAEVMSFAHVMRFILAAVRRKRILLPIPWSVSSFLGSVLGVLPGAPLTLDQVNMLKTDNVVSATAIAERRTLEGLGIVPHTVQEIVPPYLHRYRKAGQFTGSTPQDAFNIK
jgi:uncharacterized protein YbjT (DUF2867 family)